VRGVSRTGLTEGRGDAVEGAAGSASACGFAVALLTTASVSETGAPAPVAGVLGATEAGGADEAATGTG